MLDNFKNNDNVNSKMLRKLVRDDEIYDAVANKNFGLHVQVLCSLKMYLLLL